MLIFGLICWSNNAFFSSLKGYCFSCNRLSISICRSDPVSFIRLLRYVNFFTDSTVSPLFTLSDDAFVLAMLFVFFAVDCGTSLVSTVFESHHNFLKNLTIMSSAYSSTMSFSLLFTFQASGILYSVFRFQVFYFEKIEKYSILNRTGESRHPWHRPEVILKNVVSSTASVSFSSFVWLISLGLLWVYCSMSLLSTKICVEQLHSFLNPVWLSDNFSSM